MGNDLFSEIEAVLFDMDETLIDAPKGLEAAHEVVIDKLFEQSKTKEPDFSRESLLEELSEFDDRMNRERRYERDEWWSKFAEENNLNVELSTSQLEELTKNYWTEYAEAAVPYLAAEPVLDYLSSKGYKLGVVTDTDGSGISKRDRLSGLEFFDMFDTVVVGGEDTEEPKPDDKPFRMALSELGLGPEECVMVGDKPFTDIKGANSLGMKTVLVRRREWEADEEPDYTIDSLTELRKLL